MADSKLADAESQQPIVWLCPQQCTVDMFSRLFAVKVGFSLRIVTLIGIRWFSSNQVPHPPMWSSSQIRSLLHSVSVSKTYKAPQCLLVIYWLHDWALATWAEVPYCTTFKHQNP